MIADATMGLADDGRRHVRCYDSGKCGWWNDPGRRSIPTSPTLPKAARHPQLEFAPPLWTTVSLVEPSELQRAAVNGLDSDDSAFS